MVDWKPIKKDKSEYGLKWALTVGPYNLTKDELDNWVFCSYKKVENREPLVAAKKDKVSDLEKIIDELACKDFNEADEKMKKYGLKLEEVRLGFREKKKVYLLS